MGLKITQEWIICDQNFDYYLREKWRLYEKNPRKMFQVIPGDNIALEGGREVLDLFAEYLPKRYPSLYQRNGKFLKIIPLNKLVNLYDENFHPFDISGQIIQEDICLLRQNSSQKWILIAGSLFFPSSWILSEKLGLEMLGVHAPVPLLNENIGNSIYKFFTNLKPDAPLVERFNWNLETVPDLRLDPEEGGNHGIITPENIDNLTFRVERQTFKKLPKSDTILFTIGILNWPFNEIVGEGKKKKEFWWNI